MSTIENKRISCAIVVPVYFGEKYLPDLVEKIFTLKRQWDESNCPVELSEAIFVLDNPIDSSATILEEQSQKHGWINIITLAKNFGQHPATQAGILHSSSDWIVTMDEDLQHKPQMINDLFSNIAKTGNDIVYARSDQAVHQNWLRDLGSKGYKWLIAKITGNKNIQDFNSFRLVRGSVARATSSVCCHQTYFDIALSWFTSRVGVEVLPLIDKRYAVEKNSGYSLYKLFSHARRMVLSAQVKALRFGILIGLFSFFGSLIYGLKIIIVHYAFKNIPSVAGWSSLMVAILFFGGVSAILIGILIEFVSLILLHIQGKPVFFTIDRSSDCLLSSYFSGE